MDTITDVSLPSSSNKANYMIAGDVWTHSPSGSLSSDANECSQRNPGGSNSVPWESPQAWRELG